MIAEASDGEDAVRLAVGLSPDVALIDLTMPILDGVEVIRRIREMNPEVNVLVLTMHDDPAVAQAAMRAGARGYLVKDCGTDELVESVHKVARGESVIAPSLARLAMRADDSPALSLGAPLPPSVTHDSTVSQREEEILLLVALCDMEELDYAEAADALGISLKTVKNHLASVYQKLGARDRTQAVIRALRLGILNID